MLPLPKDHPIGQESQADQKGRKEKEEVIQIPGDGLQADDPEQNHKRGVKQQIVAINASIPPALI